MSVRTNSSLSPNCQRFVRLMQSLNYGRIEALHVRGGEPVFQPPPKVHRTIKIAAQNGAHAEAKIEDFALKQRVVAFFDRLREIDDGVIEVLEVAAGLPLLFEIEHKLSA